MKQLIIIICILFISTTGNSQNALDNAEMNRPKKVTHVLTPFNGMHSGFNPNGTANNYSAQVATMKNIFDFTPQNNASNPPYKMGYYQMLYAQTPNENQIQVVFSLPPQQNFTIELFVETNVDSSSYDFSIDGNTKSVMAGNGQEKLRVSFNGNTTGQYSLLINPHYIMDFTTFRLTKIKISTP